MVFSAWMIGTRRGPAARGGAVALCAALAVVPVRAQEALFTDLPTADLVEMNAVIVKELARRGVYDAVRDPTADYALWLFRAAFGLVVDKDAPPRDKDGRRYAVVGLKLGEARASLPDLAAAEFDLLGVVLFTDDHRIQRAGVVARGAIIDLIETKADVPIGPDSAFWRIPSLRDVTPTVYATATGYNERAE